MNTALDQSLATISAQLLLDVQIYLKHLKQQLIIIRDHAVAQSTAAKLSQKRQYDQRHKTKPLQFATSIGQQVLLHQPVYQPEKPRKFQIRLTGPYTVHKILPHNVHLNEQCNKTNFEGSSTFRQT